jgi:flagellar biosynthesis chaperone FliJ
VSEEQLSQCE